MLLLNIESLSDSELKYMAEQEQIDGWEEMSREDLIESLEDVFEDSSDVSSQIFGKTRFVRSLTDVPPGSLSLPGVSPLPEVYNETCIYAVEKDANWAYAMWNIAPMKKEELLEAGSRLCLRVSSGDQFYNIDVDYEDSVWNFELPWPGKTYTVSLLSITGNEEPVEEVICTSKSVSCPSFYFKDHIKDLLDKDTFKLSFDSLFTKEGRLIKNEIVSYLFSEVLNEQEKGGRK